MRLDDFAPLESTGRVESWSEEGWRTTGHDIRFEEDRVVGVVTDSAGQALELDRTVPDGILLRDLRDLAFATLQVDSVVGLSVELATFDASTGEVTHDRYDVLARDTVEALGEEREVLCVSVASGLTNDTVFFDLHYPRIALLRRSHDGSRVKRTTRVELEPSGPGEADPADAGRGRARTLLPVRGRGPDRRMAVGENATPTRSTIQCRPSNEDPSRRSH